MITVLNVIIFLMVILTFLSLIAGLLHTAKAKEGEDNKINKFMRYRVFLQLFAIVILIAAIYIKKQISG